MHKNLKTIVCNSCHERKRITEFYYHKSRKHYATRCKICSNIYSTKFQQSGYRKKSLKYIFYQRAYGIAGRRKYKKIKCMKRKQLELYLRSLWKKQEGKCYYTNHKMKLFGYHKSNYAMTVDRLNSKKGYVRGNIVLCLSIVNRMKQNLSYKELLQWCKLLLRENHCA